MAQKHVDPDPQHWLVVSGIPIHQLIDTRTMLFALGIVVDPDVLDAYQLASWIRI
jgi:hypothetical protein